ncbi:MAG: transcription antitermination factor NusB, partial [Planctomycetota bacterium]
MSRTPRPIRQLAMQLLYQLDVSGDGARAEASAEASAEATAEALRDELALSVERAEHDPGPEARAQAAELAVQAWLAREQADALTGELAPQWPAYRQPPVDRAVLRLGIYEVASEREAAKR